MGIQGFHKAVEGLSIRQSPEETLAPFKGKSLAIDLSSWLYKACYSCATDLALGKPTTRYINFVVRRLKLLKYHGVQPILVADNEATGLKAGTETDRRDKKRSKLDLGLRLWSEGRFQEADQAFQGCISITAPMVAATLDAAKEEGCDVMYAVGEADPQLAQLVCSGKAAGVITEDSDLALYSVLCPAGPFPLLLKMDEWGAASRMVCGLEKGHLTTPCAELQTPFIDKLHLFGSNCEGQRLFAQMCVLAGKIGALKTP